MEDGPNLTTRNASRLFLGLVVIALGALALLDNLGLVRIHDPWQFWPLLLVALGFGRMLRPRGCPGRWTGLMFALIGLWILGRNLGVIPWSLGDFWPVLVVLIGLRLVWGGMHRTPYLSANADNASRISAFSMLGGSEHKNNAADFRGGDATAILGGCKIDLRNASIKSGDAAIDCFAMWGGVEIIVPQDWSIVVHGTPILGAIEDKTSQTKNAGGPTLVIRGVAIMGAVEIKN